MGIYLSLAANSAVEALEWDDLLVLLDVLQELDGASEWHVFDVVADFARVFEVDSKVGSAALHGLGRIFRLS